MRGESSTCVIHVIGWFHLRFKNIGGARRLLKQCSRVNAAATAFMNCPVGRWGVDGHERGPAARRARRRREEAVDAALVVVFIPQLEHGEEELVRPRPVPVEVLETKQTQEVEVGPAPLQTLPRLVQRARTCVHVPRWCIRRVSYR